jgi:hypothetical protein
MLASITPLGERSRGSSWPITATAFAIGAIAAGAAAGLLGGALGSLLPGGGWRTVLAVVGLGVALGLDGTRLGRWLPTTRRQVNEDWLHRYRGWVYGVAFGAQLGSGLTTVVTSAAIYVTALATVLAASPLAGAALGTAFGLTRAVSLLPARTVRDPRGLLVLQRELARWGRVAAWLVVAGELVALAILLLGSLA